MQSTKRRQLAPRKKPKTAAKGLAPPKRKATSPAWEDCLYAHMARTQWEALPRPPVDPTCAYYVVQEFPRADGVGRAVLTRFDVMGRMRTAAQDLLAKMGVQGNITLTEFREMWGRR